MSTRIPFRPFRHAWWAVPITLVVAVLVGLVGRAVWTPKPVVEETIDELKPANRGWLLPPPEPDMAAATAYNSRGVELMDQLEFTEASHEFAAAVRAAPDWLPARINYGIASFNQQPAHLKQLIAQVEKARDVFASVLTRDPDNRHAHYTLGMIDLYTGEYAHAYPHFLKVSELDPDDAHTWLRVGTTHPDGNESGAAARCYEKALAIDPKLNDARYHLAMIARKEGNEPRFEELLTEHQRLQDSDQSTESRIVFGEMGRYADVIGRDPTRPGEYGGDPPKRRNRGW